MMSAHVHSAWMEIDLRCYRRNLAAIWAGKPARTEIALVIKDDAYGHGASRIAQAAGEFGPAFFAVAAVREGIELRNAGVSRRILVLGERIPDEVEMCLRHELTPCIGTLEMLRAFSSSSAEPGFPVHLKIDSGMSRYGLRPPQWREASEILAGSSLCVEGMLSHFAQSDETDKTFARRQLQSFGEAAAFFTKRGIHPKYLHMANSGGFLDLPEAHFDLVRIGILAAGVYPSKVCARQPAVEPAMSVKARIVTLKEIAAGDHVGYGMRYTATRPTRVAVLPIGYGMGFPRVRNEGCVLVHGKRAPIIGGVSMDAITVDVTAIAEARLWDVATIMGKDGTEEIDIHELAALKRSVSYDVAVSWQRLPRVYLE